MNHVRPSYRGPSPPIMPRRSKCCPSCRCRGVQPNSIEQSPTFVYLTSHDFHLQSLRGSPCIVADPGAWSMVSLSFLFQKGLLAKTPQSSRLGRSSSLTQHDRIEDSMSIFGETTCHLSTWCSVQLKPNPAQLTSRSERSSPPTESGFVSSLRLAWTLSRIDNWMYHHLSWMLTALGWSRTGSHPMRIGDLFIWALGP